MKLLPIRINGRTDYMVDFEIKPECEDSFVVESDNDGELFSFYKHIPNIYNQANNPDDLENNRNEGEGIEFQEDKSNKQLFISKFEVDENPETLKIILSYTSNTPDTQNLSVPEKLANVLSFEQLKMRFVAQNDLFTLRVTMILNTGAKELEKTMVFYLAPSEQIYNVVLDCGSEASQMAAFQRTPGRGTFGLNNRLIISTNILKHFGIPESDYEKYVQVEEGDNCLYKSVFFAKKKFYEEDIAESCIYPKVDEKETNDSVLRMCVNQEELYKLRETHLQMYNMKIAGYGGISSPEIEYEDMAGFISDYETFFQRKYVSQYIYQSLKSFCTTNPYIVAPKVLHLNVLVPNIYSYKKTYEFISTVRKDTLAMIGENKNFKNKVKGVCVNAVSESDASLIGAISLRGSADFPNGTYLVLDAGKGTLDFSLTNYAAGKFTNIMKSGFVGASAALSYGFMLDLLKEFLLENNIVSEVSEKELREFIYNNILGSNNESGADLYLLGSLMSAIDNYKISFSSLCEEEPLQTNHPETEQENLNDIKIEAFTTWIKNCKYKIKTDNLDAIMRTIVNSVSQKLLLYSAVTVDYVVFAGRGFLFAPFKTMMLDMLTRERSELKVKEFLKANDAATNKNICLFITDAINQGRYDGQRLPDPIDMNKEIIDEIGKSDFTERRENTFALQKKIRGMLKRLQQDVQSANPINNTPDKENTFVHGHEVKLGGDITIFIGGTSYNLGSQVNDGDGRLFYSNGKVFVRDCNNQVHTLKESSSLATGLSFASLFPYYGVTKMGEIYIPDTRVVPADTEQEEETVLVQEAESGAESNDGKDVVAEVEVGKPENTTGDTDIEDPLDFINKHKGK